jgi:hypothetical protein
MLSSQDVNAIGQLIDTTFGYSSTGEKTYQVPAGRSITSKLTGESGKEQLVVKFVTVVTIGGSERALIDAASPQKRELDRESIKLCGAYIDNLRKAFKDGTGKSLKTKQTSSVESVELLNYSNYSPVRQAYYRRNTVYDVSI